MILLVMSIFFSFSQVKCEEPFYQPPLQSPISSSFFSPNIFNEYEDPEPEPEVIYIDNLYIRDLIFNGTEVILDEPESLFSDDVE